jgi:hypothetical protein
MRWLSAAANESVVYDQHNHRTNHSDKHAVNVESSHARVTERVKKPTSNDRPDDTEDNIQQNTFTTLIDQFTGDESGDQSQYKPR